MEKWFIKYVNDKFWEMCKRSQMACPKELWPFLAKNGILTFNFATLEDEQNKYYTLITKMVEVGRRPENSGFWNALSNDQQEWLVDSRNFESHSDCSYFDEKGFKKGSCVDFTQLWEIIKVWNKIADYTPSFLIIN